MYLNGDGEWELERLLLKWGKSRCKSQIKIVLIHKKTSFLGKIIFMHLKLIYFIKNLIFQLYLCFSDAFIKLFFCIFFFCIK